MAQIYDRSAAELMAEAAAELEYPAARADLVAWFAERYPKLKTATVRAHIVGLTANDRNRHHYAWLAGREPLFTRAADGALSRYEPAADEDDEHSDLAEADTTVPRLEFALEAYLEEFLLTNWEAIDWAGRPLRLWESEEGVSGHQLVTAIGRLDFLCCDDETGGLTVVELKRGRPSDQVVGQIARYMGWVAQHMAEPEQPVAGLIIAHEQDARLAYAVSAVPNVEVLTYEVDFALAPAGDPPM